MVSDGIYAPALICSVENFNGEVLWTGGGVGGRGRERERDEWWREREVERRRKRKGRWKEEVRLGWKANSSMINTFVDVHILLIGSKSCVWLGRVCELIWSWRIWISFGERQIDWVYFCMVNNYGFLLRFWHINLKYFIGFKYLIMIFYN